MNQFKIFRKYISTIRKRRSFKMTRLVLLLTIVPMALFQNCSSDYKIAPEKIASSAPSQNPDTLGSGISRGTSEGTSSGMNSGSSSNSGSGSTNTGNSSSSGSSGSSGTTSGTTIVTYEAKSATYKPSNKVDVLIVMDNSGSMQEEQTAIKERFGNFISIIQDLDYRVAITSTDVAMKDGSLLHSYDGQGGTFYKFEDGSYFLTKNSTVKVNSGDCDVICLFQTKISQIGYGGSGSERGIYAANIVVGNNPNSFIRTDAHFAILVVSDENELSKGLNLVDLDKPDTLIGNIKSYLGVNKSFSFHSIVIQSPGTAPNSPDNALIVSDDNFTTKCYEQQLGAAYSSNYYGTIYEEMSKKTGGIVGSVCAVDYTKQLSEMAGDVYRSVGSIGLECMPEQDANHPVVASLDGQPFTDFYILGSKFVLKNPMATTVKISLDIKYYCKKIL